MQSNTKYLILCANCAHHSGDMKYFLLVDLQENTVEFDTEQSAKEWCNERKNPGPFAYVILCSDDFNYE